MLLLIVGGCQNSNFPSYLLYFLRDSKQIPAFGTDLNTHLNNAELKIAKPLEYAVKSLQVNSVCYEGTARQLILKGTQGRLRL